METVHHVVNSVTDTYVSLDSISDKRSRSWLMMSSPWPTLLITACYLLMVWIGPKLMQKREPFNFTKMMIPYNFAITLLNLYIAVELTLTSTLLNYKIICQPISNIDHPLEIRMAAALWWYYISKPLEFFDTLCFILRKKNNQLTFLHVYHHSTMFCLWWMAVKWVPSGFSYFGPILNSYVHVVMYSYYTLAALGPHMQKYLWWKKYLTMLQLVQFAIVMIVTGYATCVGCEFPLWMQYLLTSYMFSFILLFMNFYRSAYKKSKLRKSMTSSTSEKKTLTDTEEIFYKGNEQNIRNRKSAIG